MVLLVRLVHFVHLVRLVTLVLLVHLVHLVLLVRLVRLVRLVLLVGAQVFDKAGDYSGRFLCLRINRIEAVLINVMLIKCYIKMTLNLCRGGHCNE